MQMLAEMSSKRNSPFYINTVASVLEWKMEQGQLKTDYLASIKEFCPLLYTNLSSGSMKITLDSLRLLFTAFNSNEHMSEADNTSLR